jgi:hypothetical protein
MRTKMFVLSIVMLAVIAIPNTVVFGAEMFSGTWALNIAKTQEGLRGHGFTNPIIEKIEADDNGIKVVADTAGGAHVEYTVKFDGKDYPVTATLDGKPNPHVPVTTYSARKIDDYTIEFTMNLHGPGAREATAREIMSISKDGKTRTVTQSGGTDRTSGQPINSVIIWDKQ